MQIGDTPKSYGWLSIVLHWLAAALVIALWVLGERMDFQPTRELHRAAMMLHISVGVLAWVFLAAFIVWRLMQKSPASLEKRFALRLLAKIVQVALLLALTVQIITGPLTILALGAPLDVFGWFQIPSPLPRNHDLHELFESIHGVTANVILGLVTLHVLGALKHLLIDRDGVFQRMLGISQASADGE